jgi:hypothetical protein
MRDLSGWSGGVLANALWGNGSRGDSRKNGLWGSKDEERSEGDAEAAAAQASWADESSPS